MEACVNCKAISEFVCDESHGTFICTSCGAVQPESLIDERKPWTDYENSDETSSKAHAERVEDDIGTLSTEISFSNFGNETISSKARALARCAKMATAENRNEQKLKASFSKINEFAEQLQLSPIIRRTAKEILKTFTFDRKDDIHIKGFRKDSFLVAVLLIASKHEKGARTLKHLSKATNIEERDIKRFYKILLRKKEITSISTGQRKTTAVEVEELIGVFCNKLGFPFKIEKYSQEVGEKAVSFLEGKRPSSIAASSILFILNVMKMNFKQQELAQVAGISSNTLRNVYKELSKYVEQLPKHLFNIG